MDPNVGPMAQMGAPDFSGAPTEARRIRNGGRHAQEEPTGGKLAPAPWMSADPETECSTAAEMD